MHATAKNLIHSTSPSPSEKEPVRTSSSNCSFGSATSSHFCSTRPSGTFFFGPSCNNESSRRRSKTESSRVVDDPRTSQVSSHRRSKTESSLESSMIHERVKSRVVDVPRLTVESRVVNVPRPSRVLSRRQSKTESSTFQDRVESRVVDDPRTSQVSSRQRSKTESSRVVDDPRTSQVSSRRRSKTESSLKSSTFKDSRLSQVSSRLQTEN